MKNNLVVIPARANSKRLLNKNTKLLNGIPLITYTIRYAINFCKNSDIIVCTDCPIAKTISNNLGIMTLERPFYISNDHATTSSVLKYVLEIQQEKGCFYQSVTTLQITNPFRPANLYNDAFELFISDFHKDSVISITPNNKKIGNITNSYFESLNYQCEQRSQDINNSYFENGLIYISKPQQILEKENLFGSKILPLIVDANFPIIDIDTLEDFIEAEKILQKNRFLFDHIH